MGTILKIVFVLIAIVLLVAVGGTIRFRSILLKNGKEREPREEIYNGEGEKNALIIYQPSPHQTVDSMAEITALALQDMGYTVVMNYPGEKLDYNTDDYEVFGFGSAVYIGMVAEPLVNYIKKLHFKGKKVFLFAVGTNVKEKAELEYMESLIDGGNMVSKVKVDRNEGALIDRIVREQFQ